MDWSTLNLIALYKVYIILNYNIPTLKRCRIQTYNDMVVLMKMKPLLMERKHMMNVW